MKSANDCAREFFAIAIAHDRMVVSNVDLHAYVANITGETRQVISGTLDGVSRGTLIASDWYNEAWHKEKLANQRIIHRRNVNVPDPVLQCEKDYDYPTRREACATIMSYLPATGQPLLLTLAGALGLCIQAALQRNPNTIVENIECDLKILNRWQTEKQRLGIQSIDHCCSLQEFVRTPIFLRQQYALINVDTMGYASETMCDYLSAINKVQNTEMLAVTTQYLNKFRNHGAFQTKLRKQYEGQPDAHAQSITDWLTNYQMVDRFDYQKETGRRRMEVLIYLRDAK